MGLRLRPLHALALAGLAVAALGASTQSGAATGSTKASAPPRHPPAASTAPTSSSTAARARTADPDSSTSTTLPGTTTTSTVPTGPITIEKGGTVTVAVPYLPSEFNPATPAGANPVTAMVMAQVWPSPFVARGPQDDVAESAFVYSAETVSVNPQKIVYTIAKRARWSNGEPIDAADFVAEWHEQLAIGEDLPANDPYSGYEDIASIRGSHHGKVVTVTFTKPDVDWEALFSDLAPAAIAKRFGWSAGFAAVDLTHVVSGGPFEITKVVPGRELVLSRNPHYWGPTPHLDHIVFRVVNGEAATLADLSSGSIDVATVLPGPAERDLMASDVSLAGSDSVSPKLWQLVFNTDGPATSSLLVREAVANAIDRVELEADAIGLREPNVPDAGNHLFLSGAPNSVGNDSAYGAVDVPLADRLFAEAGYDLNADGLLHDRAGKQLVLHLVEPTGDPIAATMAAELRAQLLDAGVVLSIQRVPLAEELTSVLPNGAFQMALAPYLLSPFTTENATYYENPVPAENGADAPGDPDAARADSVTRDVLGYDDTSLDALLAQAFSELNPLTMASIVNRADVTIWADLPAIPLFQVPETLMHARDVLNVSESTTWAGPLWDAEDWAIEKPPPTTTTTTSPTATRTSSATSTTTAHAHRSR